MGKYLSIPFEEQETTISYGRTDEYAIIWTNDRTAMTKLDKLCETSPQFYKCIEVGYSRNNELMDKRYKVKKEMLSFRSKKSKPNLTEEQREQLRERLRAMREAPRADELA